MGGGMDRMRAKARALEQRIEEARKSLATQIVEGSSAGGGVRVRATGDQTLLSVEIVPEAIDPARAAELGAKILEAANDALERSKDLTRAVMERATSGVRIPGL